MTQFHANPLERRRQGCMPWQASPAFVHARRRKRENDSRRGISRRTALLNRVATESEPRFCGVEAGPKRRVQAPCCSAGIVKQNVAPLPGCDSVQMRPPWRSTILLQMASPMPVPGCSSQPCKRWKSPKIRSASAAVPAGRATRRGRVVPIRRRNVATRPRAVQTFPRLVCVWCRLRA